MLLLHACVGIDMLAEFGDAPRAMRIVWDQIGDDLLDAARTSAHMVSVPVPIGNLIRLASEAESRNASAV